MSELYVPSRFAYQRRRSRAVMVGEVQVGGDAPIVVQSMTTTPTTDVAATVGQSIRLAEAGCQIVRITAPAIGDAKALKDIRREFTAAGFGSIPLVADIHFMPAAAMEAVEHVEKVRVNPGNYADRKRFAVREYSDCEYEDELDRLHLRFSPLCLRARELGRAVRIGVNHGSLSDRIMNRYGDTPAGMVASAMEFVRIAEANDYRDLIISMKSSNPKVMVQAYRLLVAELDAHGEAYPLHLGVTEAGDGEDGRVKGAAGIGALLEDGIGDTIRVSLTEEPEAEIPVARALAAAYADPDLPRTAPIQVPPESTAVYEYRRRVAEIVRIAGDLPVGGGQLPVVLAPQRLPVADQEGTPPDAVVADAARWNAPVAGAAPLVHAEAAAELPVSLAVWSADTAPGEAAELVLLDLGATTDPVARLRATLPQVPADSLVGIAAAPGLGLTRAYRLLAAVDEQLFTEAEASEPGSGVRHACCLAWLGEADLLQASAQLGGLLIDGIGDAVYLPGLNLPCQQAFTLLQSVKARVTRADFVACPSCGRTLFDLIEVTEHIKQATAHLDGVTIAIMGCIVNGPGEMADADFGYVGQGPGKITLYRGKEPVRRNLPMDQARDALIDLIKEHGMWKDPEPATS